MGNHLGTGGTTDGFARSKCVLRLARTSIRLRRNHIFERLSLGWEQVAQHRHRRTSDGTTICLETLPAPAANAVARRITLNIWDAGGRLGPLHREVLCHAEERICAPGSERAEAGPSDEIARRLLPDGTRKTFSGWNTAGRVHARVRPHHAGLVRCACADKRQCTNGRCESRAFAQSIGWEEGGTD
jgi:hypothetical protein